MTAPSTSLLAETGRCLGLAGELRGLAGGARVRREVLVVEGEASILMGQLLWDASQRRDHASAKLHLDRAARIGREVGRPAIEGLALLRSTIVALYGERRPDAALPLAIRAAKVTRGASGILAGLAMLHAAEAQAMLREERACEDLLAEAESSLDGADENDEAFHLISPRDLPRMAGACHLALGRPQRAESVLASIGAGSLTGSKADAVILGNLALAHIRQRQIDQACAVLAQTIDLVARTWSGGGLTLIFQARRELQQWPDQPAVRDIGDRILDLIDPAGRPL
ncbi:transcriptional regulator [Frankia sp. AgB1.9]|uniref:hypothetical protein n=1 Tax=unclassified Frankia TaxID=2632575 RepID=UPI00193409B5|nr:MULTISPECIES: hypothetical protein [unclassified Frankia]MBL7491901.1 transcriptional regulator [Frankia sp. AgW1.1]MBL7550190.1 transcriptional regulator [Frankia sp. AgB1.9]MBL7619849.1 hypothetical protein [Frankia sp. AgB1.8]